MDAELARVMRRSLEKQGLAFRTGTKVPRRKANTNGVALDLEPAKGRRPRERWTPTSCWSRSAARPTPRGWGSTRSACARQSRLHQGQTAFRDERPRHLRDRRRDPRPDARPQGRGRGHGLRRDHGGPGRPYRLRCDPVGRLYLARGRLGRAHRGAAQEGRYRLQCRQVPDDGQLARPRHRRDRGASSSCWPTRRPTGCWARTSSRPMPAR